MFSTLQRAGEAIARTRPVQAYMDSLLRRPLPTKLTTSGSLMVAADITRQWLQQRESGRSFEWDPARTARYAAFAVAFHAPLTHFYHPFVERAVWPRFQIRHTGIKVALDQIFVSPFTNGAFLARGRGAGEKKLGSDERARAAAQVLSPDRGPRAGGRAGARRAAAPAPLAGLSLRLGTRALRHVQSPGARPRSLAGRGPALFRHAHVPPRERSLQGETRTLSTGSL